MHDHLTALAVCVGAAIAALGFAAAAVAALAGRRPTADGTDQDVRPAGEPATSR